LLTILACAPNGHQGDCDSLRHGCFSSMQSQSMTRGHVLAAALRKTLGCLLLAIPLSLFTPVTQADQDFLQTLEAEYGIDAGRRGQQLALMLDQLRSAPRREQLHRVNRFFNVFRFRADHKQWEREDYWASPVEFIGRFAGDCEDYAIAKYFALSWLGLDNNSMQLSYVYNTLRLEYHVVLEVRDGPSDEVMILDNTNPFVLPAHRRPELTKVVGFGDTHVSVTLPSGGEQVFERTGRWNMQQWDSVLVRADRDPGDSCPFT
jgi:predicted transglutaminase-like cysteine proteinase